MATVPTTASLTSKISVGTQYSVFGSFARATLTFVAFRLSSTWLGLKASSPSTSLRRLYSSSCSSDIGIVLFLDFSVLRDHGRRVVFAVIDDLRSLGVDVVHAVLDGLLIEDEGEHVPDDVRDHLAPEDHDVEALVLVTLLVGLEVDDEAGDLLHPLGRHDRLHRGPNAGQLPLVG